MPLLSAAVCDPYACVPILPFALLFLYSLIECVRYLHGLEASVNCMQYSVSLRVALLLVCAGAGVEALQLAGDEGEAREEAKAN